MNNNIDGWVVSVRLDKPKKSSGGLLRLGLPIDTRLIYEWVRCRFFFLKEITQKRGCEGFTTMPW